MTMGRTKRASQVGFVPIGIALIVIGMNSNGALVGAGAVFLIIGVAAIARGRKSQGSGEDPE